jgi:Ubiquitin-2 like Rad60 SUMO-like
VEKLLNAFRRQHRIDPAKDVFILLDGDKLNADDGVGDLDLEDGDNLEVYVR